MKKIEFIEIVEDRLPVKIHPRIIERYIGRAWNTVIYETFRKDFSGLDLYCKSYDSVAVNYDSTEDIYYSVSPVSFVQLPSSGNGVISIHSAKGKGIEFAATRGEMQDIQNGLEVGTLTNPIPYWTINNRIEYGNTGGIDTVQTVRMRIIPQFEALEMTDEFTFPVGSDEKILELVVQFALGKQPDKEMNDGNERTP